MRQRNTNLLLLWLLSSAVALLALPLVNPTSALSSSSFSTTQGRGPVVLTVTVINDRNEYLWDLDKSKFAVYDGKVAQEITLFKAEDEPVSVGILFDTSYSMRLGDSRSDLSARLAAEGLDAFLSQIRDGSDYFLMSIAESPKLLADWTQDKHAVREQLSQLKLKGETAFYTACLLGLEKLKSARHRKRLLLVISDGMDTEDDDKFKEVKQKLSEEDVLFYAVGFTDTSTSIWGMLGGRVLRTFGEVSGGMAVFPKNKNHLLRAFELLALELRHQYTIGFTPGGAAADGKWHKIKVEVNAPPAPSSGKKPWRARSRAGYRAEGNGP